MDPMMLMPKQAKKQQHDDTFCPCEACGTVVLRATIEHHKKVACPNKRSSSSSSQSKRKKLGNVVASSIASTPAEPKPKYRHKYYENPDEVVVTILAKGIADHCVCVSFGDQSMNLSINVPGEDSYVYRPLLYGKIVPAKCRHAVLPKQVIIHLAKAEIIDWTSLESRLGTQGTNVVSKGHHIPTYPPKLAGRVKKEEKEEKLDLYAAGLKKKEEVESKLKGTVLRKLASKILEGRMEMTDGLLWISFAASCLVCLGILIGFGLKLLSSHIE